MATTPPDKPSRRRLDPSKRPTKPVVRVKEKFRKLWREMTDDEFAAFKEDIRVNGQKYPILVWPDPADSMIHWVVDGHHRRNACRQLGIEPNYQIETKWSTEDEVVDWIFTHQTAQRNITKFEAVEAYLGTPDYQRDVDEAVDRKRFSRSTLFGDATRSATTEGTVNEIVGNKCKCSTEQVRRIKIILNSNMQNLIMATRRGELSVAEALRQIKTRDRGPALGEAQDDLAFLGRMEERRKRYELIGSAVQRDINRALIRLRPHQLARANAFVLPEAVARGELRPLRDPSYIGDDSGE